jgi:uncharacterized protein (TIGR02452 family)
MTTFTTQIPRDDAIRMGQEAVAIGEQGFYRTPSGRVIDLKEKIAQSVQGTQSYPPDFPFEDRHAGEHPTRVAVTNETTLSAATGLLHAGLNPVALNFASATHPGGGFLSGARAQEEYLARSSCLYPCIRGNAMYAYHRARSDPFYSDYMLYSPQVPIIRGDDGNLLEEPYRVSIITSAAVHASRVPPERQRDILPVMWRRMLKVLAVGIKHHHDSIVLGAWGCGAFGNDATEIACMFRQALDINFRGAYRKVVFAIVDWSPERRFIGPFEAAFRSAL